MVLDPFPIKTHIFQLKNRFWWFHWVERVGGINVGGVKCQIDRLYQQICRFLVKTSSATTPGVCLAGALFFQKKHVPFQKNTYIEVFGVKHIKFGVIFEIVYQEHKEHEHKDLSFPKWCYPIFEIAWNS